MVTSMAADPDRWGSGPGHDAVEHVLPAESSKHRPISKDLMMAHTGVCDSGARRLARQAPAGAARHRVEHRGADPAPGAPAGTVGLGVLRGRPGRGAR